MCIRDRRSTDSLVKPVRPELANRFCSITLSYGLGERPWIFAVLLVVSIKRHHWFSFSQCKVLPSYIEVSWNDHEPYTTKPGLLFQNSHFSEHIEPHFHIIAGRLLIDHYDLLASNGSLITKKKYADLIAESEVIWTLSLQEGESLTRNTSFAGVILAVSCTVYRPLGTTVYIEPSLFGFCWQPLMHAVQVVCWTSQPFH